MPYIVTTTERGPVEPGIDWSNLTSVSRRAVATLEEAKQRATAPVFAHFRAHGPAQPLYNAIEALPEHGGTIGPLPDGTVIEVEPVPWEAVAKRAGYPPLNLAALSKRHRAEYQESILGTYNNIHAAQEDR